MQNVRLIAAWLSLRESYLATVQLSSNGNISDELSIIHEVGKVLDLIGCGWKLLLNVRKFVLLNGSYDGLCQWLGVFFLDNGLG